MPASRPVRSRDSGIGFGLCQMISERSHIRRPGAPSPRGPASSSRSLGFQDALRGCTWSQLAFIAALVRSLEPDLQ